MLRSPSMVMSAGFRIVTWSIGHAVWLCGASRLRCFSEAGVTADAHMAAMTWDVALMYGEAGVFRSRFNELSRAALAHICS